MKGMKGPRMLSIASVMLSVVAGFLMIAVLAPLCVEDNVRVQKSRNDDTITRVTDYECREVENADAPIGIKKEYTFSVSDELEHDENLGFYTVHQYVEVYLDGQPVYSLTSAEENWISITVGSNWVMVPVYTEDAGKEIRVVLTPVYESFRNWQPEFMLGSRLDMYIHRLSLDLPQLVLGIAALLIGVIFLCIAAYNLLKNHRGKELADLGLFSIMMGIWRLSDTRFTPFVMPDKPVFLFYLSVVMLMLGMVPLIRSMEGRFHVRSRRIFDIYCILAAISCIVQLVLQLLGVIELRNWLYVTHITILCGIVVIIGNVLYERIKYPKNYRKRIGRRLPLICVVGVLADVVVYYVRGTSSGLLFSLTALLIYIIFMGIGMLVSFSEKEKQLAEKDRQLAEDERKLTEMRITTMISQIQPHFIYNTLGTIGQFCLEDPKKAADLVQQFSLYLRGNFTELDNPTLIRVSQELEHVRHYANIEQIRFPDMQVKYDLQAEDFLLPALTIQPLVENAIKHGLMGLESGGTVVVSTYETDRAYCVCVKDDGVGFDENAAMDGKKHIGIKNIRGRIEAMCGGTLTVDSIPGKGTSALITIQK